MNYYVLFADLRVKGLATVTTVPNNVDLLNTMSGLEQADYRDKLLRLTLSTGSGSFRGHLMGGILPLFHTDLLNALKEFGVNNYQSQPTEMLDPATNVIEYGYHLTNIIGLKACVEGYDWSAKPWDRPARIEYFQIDSTKTDNLAIFRLKEQPNLIIINQKLRDFLIEKEMVAIRMIPTEEFNSLM
ncbi:hypothetical protein [uncultured Tenacibaculum sp.]|uniref:hypothetical protein n=1 Tax=uncultured Tenacibaculum sp. TaxID=174713 RepID=UPI00261D68A8|nr:hypothetical protein [uncultured Tenacibaculum sp.]